MRRPRRRAGTAGPGTFVTTTLNQRWRVCSARGLAEDRRRREVAELGDAPARRPPARTPSARPSPRARGGRRPRGPRRRPAAARTSPRRGCRARRARRRRAPRPARARAARGRRSGTPCRRSQRPSASVTDGEHDVVDRAAELVLDRLELGAGRRRPTCSGGAGRCGTLSGEGGAGRSAAPQRRADARRRSRRSWPERAARAAGQRAQPRGRPRRGRSRARRSASASSCAPARRRARAPTACSGGGGRGRVGRRRRTARS